MKHGKVCKDNTGRNPPAINKRTWTKQKWVQALERRPSSWKHWLLQRAQAWLPATTQGSARRSDPSIDFCRCQSHKCYIDAHGAIKTHTHKIKTSSKKINGWEHVPVKELMPRTFLPSLLRMSKHLSSSCGLSFKSSEGSRSHWKHPIFRHL